MIRQEVGAVKNKTRGWGEPEMIQRELEPGAETANKKWGGSCFVVQWGVTVHVIGFVRDRCA